jgi:membrane-associated phospholipid phosphatase
MQENILFFFQSVANPALDFFFNVMSALAEQYLFIAIFGLIYWNISKKQGFALTFTFLLSVAVNDLMKMLFRTPRPFEVLNEISGKRLASATGYAFPSGHTQGATTFYLSIAQWIKKPWFWVLAIVLSILVGISRMYLGVHWPIDVVGGWFLGLIFSFWVYYHTLRLMEKPKVFNILLWSIAFVLFVILVLLSYYTKNGTIQLDLENYYKISAVVIGSLLGYFVEIKINDFKNEAKSSLKWIRYFVGLIGALALMVGLKVLGLHGEWLDFIRYFLTGAWITLFFPLFGKWIGWFASAK